MLFIFSSGVFKWELIAAGAIDMSTPYTHVNLWSVIADNDNDFHNILHFMPCERIASTLLSSFFFVSNVRDLLFLIFFPTLSHSEIRMKYLWIIVIQITYMPTKKNVDSKYQRRSNLWNQNRFCSLLCCFFSYWWYYHWPSKLLETFSIFSLYPDACEYVIDFSGFSIPFEWLSIHDCRRRYLIRHICCNGDRKQPKCCVGRIKLMLRLLKNLKVFVWKTKIVDFMRTSTWNKYVANSRKSRQLWLRYDHVLINHSADDVEYSMCCAALHSAYHKNLIFHQFSISMRWVCTLHIHRL